MRSAEENPFRVTRIEALRYRAPGFRVDGFFARLEALGNRGAVVGPHGSGKTTLLLEARDHLEACGVPVAFLIVNDLLPRKRRHVVQFVQSLRPDTVLLLDGAGHLDPLMWWWLSLHTRRLRGFVATMHRRGRLPVLHEATVGDALLRELLEELVPGEIDSWWPRAQDHFTRLGGNIRDVFFALYDDAASRNGDGGTRLQPGA